MTDEHLWPLPPSPGVTEQTWLNRPDWECGRCGRVWRLGVYGHWQEVRGPTHSKEDAE